MSYTLPDTPLLTALYSRLTSNAATSSYTVYQSGAVPTDAAFPYLTYEVVTNRFRATTTHNYTETQVQVTARTRTAVGTGTSNAAAVMAAAVLVAMADPLAVTGYSLTDPVPPSATPLSYQQDGFMHRDHAVTFRFTLTPTT